MCRRSVKITSILGTTSNNHRSHLFAKCKNTHTVRRAVKLTLFFGCMNKRRNRHDEFRYVCVLCVSSFVGFCLGLLLLSRVCFCTVKWCRPLPRNTLPDPNPVVLAAPTTTHFVRNRNLRQSARRTHNHHRSHLFRRRSIPLPSFSSPPVPPYLDARRSLSSWQPSRIANI